MEHVAGNLSIAIEDRRRLSLTLLAELLQTTTWVDQQPHSRIPKPLQTIRSVRSLGDVVGPLDAVEEQLLAVRSFGRTVLELDRMFLVRTTNGGDVSATGLPAVVTSFWVEAATGVLSVQQHSSADHFRHMPDSAVYPLKGILQQSEIRQHAALHQLIGAIM